MAMAGSEICERHLVRTADLGVLLVNLARESVGRKPFGHRICLEERPIDSLGCCAQHAVKLDGVWHHLLLSYALSITWKSYSFIMPDQGTSSIPWQEFPAQPPPSAD